MKIKTKHDFNFTNQYVFPAVMGDVELCKELIERIFQGQKVVSISDNTKVDIEKTIMGDSISKGVRMDVVFENDSEIYDIEMQVADMNNLDKRTRYYSSMLDMGLISHGADYGQLKKRYVIFICPFDRGKLGKAIYTCSTCDMKNEVQVKDGRYIMFVNTTSIEGSISKELKNLFEYINTNSYEGDDEFLSRIDERVSKVNREERQAIMYYEDHVKMEAKRAEERGIAKGRAEGANQATIEIAKKLFNGGIPVSTIVAATGLTKEEVERL